MGAYGSRKTLPGLQPCPYDNDVRKEFQPLISAACQLGVLSETGSDALDAPLYRGQGSDLCRKLKIM